MRLDRDTRMNGVIDGDYCLCVARNMLDTFQEAELENDGFNSLEMLMIKTLFDDIFENNIKNNYKTGRDNIASLLAGVGSDNLNESADRDVISLFDFLDQNN
ncbi:hypothetical protein [Natroniella sp. ANB-PHB2]|uniref:hypothetical protein n=1 Tax=Natroniella sp. ANB-PHB2 TaxID=3384444 RepID=UPI0038D37794